MFFNSRSSLKINYADNCVKTVSTPGDTANIPSEPGSTATLHPTTTSSPPPHSCVASHCLLSPASCGVPPLHHAEWGGHYKSRTLQVLSYVTPALILPNGLFISPPLCGVLPILVVQLPAVVSCSSQILITLPCQLHA